MSIFSLFKRNKKAPASIVKKHNGKPFRYDIQALRAFAVVAVVLYHLWPNRLVGGFSGVDIFFVISGFLMTTSVMGHLKPYIDTKTITLRNTATVLVEFYARRIRRLIPAALTTLSAVLVGTYFTNNLTVVVDTAKSVIASATFWQNWNLTSQSVDYLESTGTPLATEHYWSLSVEEQFYLIWPLILIGATLLTINIVIMYKKKRISGAILPITLLAIASFAYGYWLTQDNPANAYFVTPARVWELMIGGIIAFLPAIKNYDLKLLMPHVGLAMCLYSIFFITGEGFPGWHALIPTLGTAMIIWAGIDRSESRLSFNSLFSLKPIQWIGNISYSVYLWHFPLIVLLPIFIKRDIDGPGTYVIKAAIIALTLILAQLSYRYVEETTRKARIKTRYVYLLFVLATGLVAGGGFALQKHSQNQIDIQLEAMHAAALDESNLCFGARALVSKDKCDNPYGQIRSSWANIAEEDHYNESVLSGSIDCTNKINGKKMKRYKFCTAGDKQSEKYIVIYGDSHARHYINTLDYIGRKNNFKIVAFTHTHCSSPSARKNRQYCREIINYLNNSSVLFDNAHAVIFSTLYRNGAASFIETDLDIISRLTSKKVLFIEDNVNVTPDQFINCVNIKIDCISNKAKVAKQKDNVLNELIARGSLVEDQIIRTKDILCHDNKCYSSIGGVPVFVNTGYAMNKTNNSHFTASYSYSLGPLLEKKLQDKGVL